MPHTPTHRDTRKSRLRRRTRGSLARQSLRPSRLTPQQRQQRQQELLEQAQQEALTEFQKEQEKKFEKTITSKEKQLNQIKSNIQKFIQEEGRRSPGLDKQRRLLQDEIASLKRSKERNIPFEQASSFAVRRAKASEEQVRTLPKRIEAQKQIQELRQEGIDVGKLQRGTLRVEDLSPKQLDVLQRQGLVEVTGTQIGPPDRLTDQQIRQRAEQLQKVNRAAGGTATVEEIEKNIRSFQRGEIPSASEAITLDPSSIRNRLKEFTGEISPKKATIEGITIDFDESALQIGKKIGNIQKKLGRAIDIRDIAEAQGFPVFRPEVPEGRIEPALSEAGRKISEKIGTEGFGRLFLQRRVGEIDRFVKELQRAEENLQKVPTKTLRNFVRNVYLPLVASGATLNEIENAVQSELGGVTDAQGNFIFTPIQSERLGSLIKEVTVGLGAGAGLGKIATLGRGAVLKALPSGLTKTNKFKNIVSVLDASVLAGLSVAEANRIKRTFEREGQDAALIELIGSLSFVKGFAKTGIKTDAQARKEFQDLANKFKGILPKGKRGQADPFALLRKKRKIRDPETGRIIEVTEEEFQAIQRRIRGEIERKLLNTKTPEEQYRILAELRKRIGGKQNKEEFDKFILNLFEKGIIKGAEVEVAPGITKRVFGARPTPPPTARISGIPAIPRTKKEEFEDLRKGLPVIVEGTGIEGLASSKTLSQLRSRFKQIQTEEEFIQFPPGTQKTFFGSKQTPRQRNINRLFNNRQKELQRIQNARLKQQERQLKAQQSLGEKYKQAQQLKTQTRTKTLLDTRIKNMNKQIQRLKTLQKSRTLTKTQTKQLQRLKTKTKQLNKLKIKQLERLRIRTKLKPRPKLKIRPPPPTLEFDLEGKKKKKRGKRKPFSTNKFHVHIKKPGGKKTGFTKLVRSFNNKKQAERELRKRLERSLKASGFVTDPTGKKVKPRVTKGFRRSKTQKNVLVEKKSNRITKGTPEVTEIQSARRKLKTSKPFSKKRKSKAFKGSKSNLKSTKLIKRRKK